MEVLSPKSSNLPFKPRPAMKKPAATIRPVAEEKPTNPDRIDDKWRPPTTVTEPGDQSETYITGKKLGKGGFAVCFEGRTKSNAEVFALKVVKAEVQQKKMMEKFRTEMQIHAKMQHPNIVEFYRAFSLSGHTYVVLELCNNGSLTDMVKSRSCLSLPEVRRFMVQICGGVKYMHKRSVIHRDLKMGNIFIDSKMNLKIGDFGLAAVMADEQDRRTTLCGTPNYIAPEILSKSGTRGHDFKVDTWAIGVICYAMLMGTPPFQSKTQQEIYSKLKTLEYEWKIDSINYIPQDAKDFVAACLNLVAAERPDMDELVEYDFFKTGAIADVLDVSCLKSKPVWLENADPRGDRVSRGYGVDHGTICTQCGVGKTLDGRSRSAVGGKAKISALVEIELENRQGTAPTTPLPEGILYKQFAEVRTEWLSIQRHHLSSKPRGRKPIGEIADEMMTLPKATNTNTNNMPAPSMLPPRALPLPRPAQSFAAQQRQQALPRNTLSRSVTGPKENTPTLPISSADEPQAEQQGLLKARPLRAASIRNTKTATHSHEDAIPKSSTVSGRLDELSERLMRETDEAESRPKSSGSGSLPTRSRPLRARPGNSAKPISTSNIEAAEVETQPLRPVTGNARDVRMGDKKQTSSDSCIEISDSIPSEGFELPKHRSSFKPRLIEISESYNLVPSSSHAKVMRSLRDLHIALGLNSNDARKSTSTARTASISPHPRVDKWVDYATKHGIAYILTDGSLGMILKSKVEDSASGSCIVVRNARRHTVYRARGIEHQFVPQGADVPDIEFYEQVDAAYAMKRVDIPSDRFKLDLLTHTTQTAAATTLLNIMKGSDVQKMKEIGLLDKFGRYMNKQMGASDLTEPDQQSDKLKGHFIHFYQRMGNVGVWRFAQGGLQFNFPDHTKLVIHQSSYPSDNDPEILVDAVYLEARDARDLAAHGRLTNEALERRNTKTFRLQDIRDNALRRTETEIIRTNEIVEKLSWIRAVVGCWIKEGGLGWTGEEKLGWSGLQERRDDKRIKLQWVTVGRPGGDDDVAAAV